MGQFFNNKQPVPQPPLLLVPLQQLADLIIKFHVAFPNHSHFPCCHCILFSCLYYWSENSLLSYPQTIPSNPRRDYGHVSHADKVFLRLSHKTLSQRHLTTLDSQACTILHIRWRPSTTSSYDIHTKETELVWNLYLSKTPKLHHCSQTPLWLPQLHRKLPLLQLPYL